MVKHPTETTGFARLVAMLETDDETERAYIAARDESRRNAYGAIQRQAMLERNRRTFANELARPCRRDELAAEMSIDERITYRILERPFQRAIDRIIDLEEEARD